MKYSLTLYNLAKMRKKYSHTLLLFKRFIVLLKSKKISELRITKKLKFKIIGEKRFGRNLFRYSPFFLYIYIYRYIYIYIYFKKDFSCKQNNFYFSENFHHISDFNTCSKKCLP